MKAFGLATAMALAAGVACNAIEYPVSPPANACPSSPCSAYVQAGAQPSCSSGACLVNAPATGLVLVVALPLTSGYAPGSTFVTLYDQFLADAQAHLSDEPDAAPMPGCTSCASLPNFVAVQGAYFIDESAATPLNFPLGNVGPTSLPAEATFRLLWPLAGGGSVVTAEALGLPNEPVRTVPVPLYPPVAPFASQYAPPGPAGLPSLGFRAFLQPGSYEIILRPSPPFDSVFGPEVSSVVLASADPVVNLSPSCSAETTAQLQCVDGFDVTQETGQGRPTLPTFDIFRTNGLGGWTAYLRDSSRTVVSNVAPLAGSAAHVILATHHLAAQGVAGSDALTGTALVIAPPVGAPYPTAVFAPIGNVLPATETYPPLPAPAVIAGSIVAEDGTAIAADVFFEALAITDANGISNSSNFEFVGEAQASPSGSFGLPTYTIEVPQGTYRVSARPHDPALQVTSVTVVVGSQNDPSLGNIVVAPTRTVSGAASVADGRDLSAAEVDAEPVACAEGGATWCMPREATAITAADGSFQLTLDPGQYLLRVRPADGTRLPWTSRPLSVGPHDAPTTLTSITVPAPAAAGLTLLDPTGAPIAQAQVRFFSLAPGTAAVEVGRALTAQDGTFEMYLQPPGQ